MTKFYFSDDYSDNCFTKDAWLEIMNEEGYETLKLFPAKMVIGDGYFFCNELGEIGEAGEDCGKSCSKYKPRNGKNGRCRYSMNTYEPDENKKPIIIKQQ